MSTAVGLKESQEMVGTLALIGGGGAGMMVPGVRHGGFQGNSGKVMPQIPQPSQHIVLWHKVFNKISVKTRIKYMRDRACLVEDKNHHLVSARFLDFVFHNTTSTAHWVSGIEDLSQVAEHDRIRVRGRLA